ncbi:kinase-like protein [Astrocystis sublimbata]|nr:kinase-like protein [Astrocystis sublimbata]
MPRILSQQELAGAQQLAAPSPVYRVDARTVVKSGHSTRLSEAEVMKFVRNNTSIPVPEVYNAYKDAESGRTRIVMEFVEGVPLTEAWDTYSDPEKDSVIAQLRSYMDELRQLKGNFIGGLDGSRCEDLFFEGLEGYRGPFEDEEAFTAGLVEAMKQARHELYADVEIVCDMFLEVMKGHEIVFTHNDFAPRNILVQGSNVVAILDWEFAGFYPDYWEYCKAMRHPDWHTDWVSDRAVDGILEPYFMELSVMWHTKEYTL